MNRRSEVCGIMFYLRGPRKMLFIAVWEIDQGRVFFYDCNGKRYRELRGIELKSHQDSFSADDVSPSE